MPPFERMNRNQIRRDQLRDMAERTLTALTWATAILGAAYLLSLFAQMITLLNQSW